MHMHMTNARLHVFTNQDSVSRVRHAYTISKATSAGLELFVDACKRSLDVGIYHVHGAVGVDVRNLACAEQTRNATCVFVHSF